MAAPASRPPVIVINSHVAYGGVGNRAAVFALERLGFPVLAVPTVILPFHPGHGKGARIVPPAEAFATLLAHLDKVPGLGSVAAVLSGYLGAPEQAAAVASLVRTVKARNPAARYLLDPVLGDGGALYMPAAIVEAVRAELLPLADITTPNRTELGFLAGLSPPDNFGLIAAARKLGPREVVVTSSFATPGESKSMLVTPDAAYLARHRTYDDAPHGVGDLLSALYLAARLDNVAASLALERAVSAVLGLVARAVADKADELPLAAGQDLLQAPSAGVTIEKID